MKQAFLIARHEYIKYVTRRGFLLSVLLFPIWVGLAAYLPSVFQKAAPERTFALIDHEGGYAEVLARGVARATARNTLSDLSDFADKWHVDHEKLRAAAPDIDDMIKEPARESSLDAFLARGGLDPVFKILAPYLAPGWTMFEARKPPFRFVATPDELAGAGDVAKAVVPYFKAERSVEGGRRLSVLLIVPKGFDDGGQPAQYLTADLEDGVLQNFIRQTLTAELRLRAVSRLLPGNAAIVPALHLSADLDASDPTNKNENPVAAIVTRIMPVAFAFLLFFATFINATALLTGVIEEKSTRMVEILMSCASAREIMVGKLIGAIGASLTTFIIWGVGLTALALAVAPADVIHLIVAGLRELIKIENLPFLVIYFVCGLMIYGSIYLAIGSMAASITDAQALLGPASLIIFLPNLLIGAIMADPNGLLARVVSWIPIYTPFYMLMRLPARPAPWELYGTTALTLATTVFLLIRMSEVFANHLLTTERPPAFASLVRGVLARLGGAGKKPA